jgi:hypothetical protein
MIGRAWIAVFVLACGGSNATITPVVELPTPQPTASKTYPIRMARALHVGQKMHVVSDAEELRTTTMTREGSVVDKKRTDSRMHLDAVVTVEALDDKEDALKALYDVKDLSASGDKMKSLLHDQHVEITHAKKEDDAIISVDGAPAPPELREALRMVLSLRTGGPTDDEVFGSKVPRAVGAHWPIDARRALDDLIADQGDVMADATIDGDVWVAGVTQSAGMDCLELRSELHIGHINVPQAPAGSTVVGGSATASFEGMFPIDEHVPRLSDQLGLVMSIKLEVPTPSGKVLVQVDGVNKRDRHTTPL